MIKIILQLLGFPQVFWCDSSKNELSIHTQAKQTTENSRQPLGKCQSWQTAPIGLYFFKRRHFLSSNLHQYKNTQLGNAFIFLRRHIITVNRMSVSDLISASHYLITEEALWLGLHKGLTAFCYTLCC